MMHPVTALIGAKAQSAKRAMLRNMRDPMAVQEAILTDLLAHHKDTVNGRALGLADIRNVEQFRARVPIRTYPDYESLIQRIERGEPRVLTPDPILYLNVTSGTTGPQKRIPVTKRFRKHLSRAQFAAYGFGVDAFRTYANGFAKTDRPRMNKFLLGQTTANFGTTDSGIPYGRATSGRIQSARFLLNGLLAHPTETMGVANAHGRHYLTLLFALAHADLSTILVGFPINALHLCEALEDTASQLIEDLASGTITSDIPIDPALRQCLAQRLRADPHRAATLRATLERDGTLLPKTAWHNLSTLITGMGGPSEFYVQRLRHYIGETPLFGGNYSASEGPIGVYTEFNSHHCALAIESGFFELVPEDQWDEAHPKTILPADAQTGAQYRVIMSNFTGMMRYDIEDIVEVVGFMERTPMITFQRRRGGQLSSVLEKTTEHHVNTVMHALQERFGPILKEFCVTLCPEEMPSPYLVNIELANGQTLADPHAFLDAFDQTLKEVNWLYGMLRKGRIPPPRLRILAPGSFAALRRSLIKQANPNADLKLPHLHEDRQYLSGLTAFEEITLEELV